MCLSYPVFLKRLFSSSHLCIGKHPLENPNNPSLCWVNGLQGDIKLPTPYITWSCKEPPSRNLKPLKAVSPIKET